MRGRLLAGEPPPSPLPSSISRAPAAQTLLCRQGWGRGVPGEGCAFTLNSRKRPFRIT